MQISDLRLGNTFHRRRHVHQPHWQSNHESNPSKSRCPLDGGIVLARASHRQTCPLEKASEVSRGQARYVVATPVLLPLPPCAEQPEHLPSSDTSEHRLYREHLQNLKVIEHLEFHEQDFRRGFGFPHSFLSIQRRQRDQNLQL